MNKYQRQRSKTIKQIMGCDPFGRRTFAQARRIYNMWRLSCKIGAKLAKQLCEERSGGAS